jgi:uncharacterized membrane protein
LSEFAPSWLELPDCKDSPVLQRIGGSVLILVGLKPYLAILFDLKDETMTQTPNIPPIIESDDREYRDTGVPSTVAVAGHPFHPLLVTFPIAFLTAVLATDLAYWFTQDLFWARASVWLIGAGLLTGILAAITGMLDFIKITRVRQHNAGWVHMIGNVIALGLSAVNLWLRWGNAENAVVPVGLIISLVVATALGITGWYGAELVYRHKVAVIGYGPNERP